MANGVQLIHDSSDTNQWHYVYTKSNPADDASRGLNVTNTTKVPRWYNGPAFLWQTEEFWSLEKDSCPSLDESDPETKHEVEVNITRTCSNSVLTWLEERISDWTKMKRIIQIVLKYVQKLKGELLPPSDVLTATFSGEVDIELLEKASIKIIKMLQQREFLEELRIIKKAHKQNPSIDDQTIVTKASPIYRLGPFLNDNGVLRVGGRLKNSSLNWNLMHPILRVITSRTIDWCHNRSGHSVRNMTLNEIRCTGFWIINGNAVLRSHVYHCVTCRKLKCKLGEEKIADFL